MATPVFFDPVFFDVDTQIDFLFPAGALYVPGAETILPAIAALNEYAAKMGFPIISTVDSHTPEDPEFHAWPPHCIAGTQGQRKPESTLSGGNQTIFKKQVVNCFADQRLPKLLATLDAGEYVVYGVVTEICVRHAAFGLLETGKPVSIVADAVKHLDPGKAQAMLADFEAAGGRLTNVADAIMPRKSARTTT